MPERFARVTALALLIVLLLALPLLVSLFSSLQANRAAPTPTAVAVALPTATGPIITPTSTVTPMASPTLLPSPLPTTGCPNPATPEPFWVDPVISPTSALSQTISVTIGRGREIDIASESGTVKLPGDFSLSHPVEIPIPLLPDKSHHLVVSAQVEYAPGCFYTLQTRTDRVGNPLVIVQQPGSVTPNLTIIPPPVTVTPTSSFVIVTPGTTLTPPASGTVYLKPFTQVFALNQDTPVTTGGTWLYEADLASPFQVLAEQGAFAHLSGHGGSLNFWTLTTNLLPSPAPLPQSDVSVAGKTVQLVPGTLFACEGSYPNPVILGACSEFQDVPQAQVIQRATADSSVLYELRFNNKIYWVSASALKTQP